MGQFKESCNKVGGLRFHNWIAMFLVLVGLGLTKANAGMIESIEELEKLEKQRGRPIQETPEVEPEPDSKKPDSSQPKVDSDTKPQREARPSLTPDQPSPASSSESDEQARKERAKAPIRLKSDGRSTYSRDGGLIHMRENVVVTQEDLRLTADEAKVFVDDSNEDDQVERVEMLGSVKFNKFDERPGEQVSAHGDRAIFINARQEIELIGNARIWKGNQLIRGKRMIYDIQTGMIEVDQAVGVMQPEEN